MKSKYLWVILILFIILRIYNSFRINDYPNGVKIRISSTITSEPILYENSQRIVVKNFSLYLPKYPELNYGDKVVIEGEVDGRKLKNPELISFEKNKSTMLNFRNNLIEFYRRTLPQNHAALVSGMVIGSKSLLSSDFWELLKASGTAHVVVASGMNVSLLAGFLINFFVSFMNRKKALIIAFILIWIYAFLAGFDAPIIRAAIMGSLTFSAQKLGKISQSQRVLFLTFTLMLLYRPEWIIDYGFILSFAATLSIMLFEASIRRRLSVIPKFFREDLSTTLAAQIFVSPIIFFSFGQFNILSPLINALVLWTVPLITILGSIGGVTGLIVYPVGKGILYLAYPLTYWFLRILELFG